MPWVVFIVSVLLRGFSYNQPNKYSNMVFPIMISMRFSKTWDSAGTEGPQTVDQPTSSSTQQSSDCGEMPFPHLYFP